MPSSQCDPSLFEMNVKAPEPRLRTADKTPPPYPLGVFKQDTISRIATDIIYLLHTRGEARLEGSDWERIFANGVGAEWRPSNIGLDDVLLGNCCWGAKTVKALRPATATKVRLISGRNSPNYSYGEGNVKQLPVEDLGNRILEIWNSRVSSVRQRFPHCRTVVLIKSADLTECVIFEFETLRFEVERYRWEWNDRGNLQGHDDAGQHKFTWQPHGSQFTIIEHVPANRIAIKIRRPTPLSKEFALKALGVDNTWIEVL